MRNLLSSRVAQYAAWGLVLFVGWLSGFWGLRNWGQLPARSDATVVPSSPVSVARQIADRHLWGEGRAEDEAGQYTDWDRFALVGWVTRSAVSPGWALVSVDGAEPVLVREGESVLPGLVLQQLMADRARLVGPGGERELQLNGGDGVYSEPDQVQGE